VLVAVKLYTPQCGIKKNLKANLQRVGILQFERCKSTSSHELSAHIAAIESLFLLAFTLQLTLSAVYPVKQVEAN
jgi:hypothetical protein